MHECFPKHLRKGTPRNTVEVAGGRVASVSACAGLTNQLLSCWVDPRIAWKKHRHSNCKRPVGGGGGTPRALLLTGAKKVPSVVPD